MRLFARIDKHAELGNHRPLPEHCGITSSGLELERLVCTEVLGSHDWELDDMQALLIVLRGLGFTVTVQSFEGERWQAVATYGELTPKTTRMVVERADNSPAIALARAALAAVRHWPEAHRT